MSCCGPTNTENIETSPLELLDDDKSLSKIAKALSHEVRVQIVRYLIEEDQCITGDFVKRLPLAQSTVSQHLKILKDAKLLSVAYEGKKSFYCVNKDTLRKFRGLVATL